MAVYFFWGQEEYLMDIEIRKLKNQLLDSAFITMSYKTFDNPPFNTLLECLQAAPLMFGKTLSTISLDKYLIGNKMSLDDKQVESIEFALKNINDSVNIIFICKVPRDEKKKPDSRKKFFKILSKYSQVREFAQFRTFDKGLNAQVSAMAKGKEISISSDNIEYLIQQLGVNLTLIDSELDKLKIAVYPKKSIEKDDIKKYCTSTEDVFLIADLIIQGNKDELLKQYNLLIDKKHPLEIFGALQSNFQKFIYIKNYEKRMSSQEMANNLRPIPEFIINKIKENLRNTTLDKLVQIRKNLIEAEYKIKSGQKISDDIVMETVLLS